MSYLRSIVLIGFMGTGKSSVGRLLSDRLRWPLVDLDITIEEQLDMPISEIFFRLGEERFREQERAVVQNLMPVPPSIIVTGGGTVLQRSNVIRLREIGVVICLTTDVNELQARLLAQHTRPLLQTKDPGRTIEELLAKRAPLYHEAADLTFDTSSLSPQQVADSILDALAVTN